VPYRIVYEADWCVKVVRLSNNASILKKW
jgi:hypothetical protein